jgi:hypothetical protein
MNSQPHKPVRCEHVLVTAVCLRTWAPYLHYSENFRLSVWVMLVHFCLVGKTLCCALPDVVHVQMQQGLGSRWQQWFPSCRRFVAYVFRVEATGFSETIGITDWTTLCQPRGLKRAVVLPFGVPVRSSAYRFHRSMKWAPFFVMKPTSTVSALGSRHAVPDRRRFRADHFIRCLHEVPSGAGVDMQTAHRSKKSLCEASLFAPFWFAIERFDLPEHDPNDLLISLAISVGVGPLPPLILPHSACHWL